MRTFHWMILLQILSFNLLSFSLAWILLKRANVIKQWESILMWSWPLIMTSIAFVQLGAPPPWRTFLRHYFYFPLSVGMVWNLMLQVVFLAVVLLAYFFFGVRTFVRHWFEQKRERSPQPLPLPEPGISRRKFIYLAAVGAVPATALGAGLHGTSTQDDLRVRNIDIPIAGLPPGLAGVTITHLSDLHSGLYCGPKKLRLMSDASNDLKSDFVVVTGDITNDSVTDLPAAIKELKRIETNHGLFVCEGNHDFLTDRRALRQACVDAKLSYLAFSRTPLVLNGCTIHIAGLPWFGSEFAMQGNAAQRLFAEPRKENEVRILLAHHPHVFDHTGNAIDLTLSGHTHGGQMMFGSIGFGPVFFKYWSGLYRRGNSSLVISNGCGDWFPCRIGAPAEILRLTLRAA